MTQQPTYIDDQVWYILTELNHPEPHLQTSRLRAGRGAISMVESPMADDGDDSTDAWRAIGDRRDVVDNCFMLPGHGLLDLSRIVITTDAGVGKSAAIAWLCAAWNLPSSRTLAFQVPLGELDGTVDTTHDRLMQWLAAQLRDAARDRGCTIDSARAIIERHRRLGRLVLLFDGLDQAIHVERLHQVLKDEYWSKCRFVLAGRPYALQTHWSKLFAHHVWRFIKLDEFDENQQRRYLGSRADGSDRLDAIPTDARAILTVPRVLSYLRELSESQLDSIRTAADVYFLAIRNLIKRGMQNSATARLIGWDDDRAPAAPQELGILAALQLLGAIAFEMTSRTIRIRTGTDATEAEFVERPNFYRISRSEFPKFHEQLRLRCPSGNFARNWRGLSALNDVLAHAVFDTDAEGLSEIEFRNRSLQEFLCAYYLAQNATQHDAERLWNWIFLTDDPATEEYYYVWQFLAEMHHDARDTTSWLHAVSPLYRPCFQRDDGSWDAKRSSEMIFRSWPRLNGYCEQGEPSALRIRNDWWDEFERVIIAGQQGRERQQAAQDLQRSFLTLPAGSYSMGSPQGRGGMPKDRRLFWERWLRDAPSDDAEIRAYVDLILNQNDFGIGRQAINRRNEVGDLLSRAIQGFGIALLEATWYPGDETPRVRQQEIGAFQLGRVPSLNAWHRLFSPRHGCSGQLANRYERYSDAPNCPVIYLNWFDAWAFATWARWDGVSCRLPWENEWEYACKFGTPWDQDYWWGEDFRTELANAENRTGRTTPPSRLHVNPHTRKLDGDQIGLQDMIGNVCEWCQDIYRGVYVREHRDAPGDAKSSRVLRGGAFLNLADLCRSAYRYLRLPNFTVHDSGVRLARALRKP